MYRVMSYNFLKYVEILAQPSIFYFHQEPSVGIMAPERSNRGQNVKFCEYPHMNLLLS